MPTRKKNTTLTRKRKRPTKKQIRGIIKAAKQKAKQKKEISKKTENLRPPRPKFLKTSALKEKFHRHRPKFLKTSALKEKFHNVNLGNISKKWHGKMSQELKILKSFQWPHLVGFNWKCPPKQSREEIAQAGGRRRKTRRRRRARKRHTRRKRRRKRRKRWRKFHKKKSLTASMKQLKSWIGSTEFNKLKI